jgi:hypothetical protein
MHRAVQVTSRDTDLQRGLGDRPALAAELITGGLDPSLPDDTDDERR